MAAPEQWPWSSFLWYLARDRGPVKINDTDILVMTVRFENRMKYDESEVKGISS